MERARPNPLPSARVEVRASRSSDLRSIIRLLRQLWPGKRVDARAVAMILRRSAREGAHSYHVAAVEGRVVGFLSLAVSWNLWRCDRVACVNELVVDEGARRMGVGRALMAEAERLANSRGCVAVELDSAPHRAAAHAFYQALGYDGRAVRFAKELPSR